MKHAFLFLFFAATAASAATPKLPLVEVPSTRGTSDTLVVFVSGDDGSAPVARSAYALERPEGLLHLGTSDRRGAVVELLLGRGTIRLRVASPAALPAPH